MQKPDNKTLPRDASVKQLLTEEESKIVHLIGSIAVSNTLKKAYEGEKGHQVSKNFGRQAKQL